MPISANSLIGTHDIAFITLDTLRYDVAETALKAGRTPCLEKLLPGGVWEKRHSPGTFTYAAHHAFFAGFLPTPVSPKGHKRLFASSFDGSTTTGEHTFTFNQPDLPSALASHGYHTICIGGVGFFNKKTPLGSVLPNLFLESHWSEDLGVTSPSSTEKQVDQSLSSIETLSDSKRVFLFLNVSAMHQPNCIFAHQDHDDVRSQEAALSYADSHLGHLLEQMRRRAPLLCIICSDHGTAYGDDGYEGHRLSHQSVLDIPYAEMILPQLNERTQ